MGKKTGRPPGDDAWANLDESDEWGEEKTPPPNQRDTAESVVADGGGQTRDASLGRYTLEGQTQEGEKVVLRLGSPTLTLGRSSRNQLVVADSSISREHARLERQSDGRWKVIDLSSGNGTFVANQRVDQVFIKHGDEVVFGHVRMRLLDAKGLKLAAMVPSESASAGPLFVPSQKVAGAAPRALTKTWLPSKKGRVTTVFVLVAMAWGAMFWRNRHIRELAVGHCQTGLKAFNAGRWDKAEQAFAAALAQIPSHPLALRYADAVAKVRNDAQRLAEVAAERGAGRLPEARTLLASVGTTPLLNEALAQAEAVRAASDQLIEQAETALEANLDMEGRALLGRLGTPPPDRPDVTALNTWLATKSELGPLSLRAKAMPKGQKPKTLMVVAQTQPAAMRRAIAAFRRSRPEEVLQVTQRALGRPTTPPEQELLRLSAAFVRTWRTAMGEHRGKRAFAAIRLFTEARSLAERIAGDRSEPARNCAEKLADMYYVLGVLALGSDKLAEASEALHTAVALSPTHALSRRKIGELEIRAQKLVAEASLMQVTHASRARELCRKVIEAMPDRSPAARQARALERRLRP